MTEFLRGKDISLASSKYVIIFLSLHLIENSFAQTKKVIQAKSIRLLLWFIE
jgi:hypothetical protein